MAIHPGEKFSGFLILIITFIVCYFVVAPNSFLSWSGYIILSLFAFAIIKAINNARINSIRKKCKHEYELTWSGELRCKKCNHQSGDISGY
jgi:hypothetical protein